MFHADNENKKNETTEGIELPNRKSIRILEEKENKTNNSESGKWR